MSKKTTTVTIDSFPTQMPIPVKQPPKQPTGNGTATFKTATAAAKAAIEARDEIRKELANAKGDIYSVYQGCVREKLACRNALHKIHRYICIDLWALGICTASVIGLAVVYLLR